MRFLLPLTCVLSLGLLTQCASHKVAKDTAAPNAADAAKVQKKGWFSQNKPDTAADTKPEEKKEEKKEEEKKPQKTEAERIAEAKKNMVPGVAKRIDINLSTQRGKLLQGEKELYSFAVCSGKKSTPTPTGSYSILEKDRHHSSNLYPDSPMPYFMRLTWDGVGLHQGPMRSRPSSHGCIRLSRSTAAFLFSVCPGGTSVKVHK